MDAAAVDMSSQGRELVFLILQYLNEEGLKQSVCMLECETGYYFYMNFFEEMVLTGNWEEAGKRLRSIFPVSLRQHESLADYGDTNSARRNTMIELKRVTEANPIFQGKLNFPTMNGNRLRHLISQSLNWQHLCCTYPHPIPYTNTLFEDHVCHPPVYHSLAQSANSNTLSSQASPNPTFVASTSYPVSDEATSAAFTYPGLDRPGSLSKTVARILNEESSSPVSMDFHPVLHILLLGPSLTIQTFILLLPMSLKWCLLAIVAGEIFSWNKYRGQDCGTFSLVQSFFQELSRFGIWGDAQFCQRNDLAFSYPNEQLLVLTCGDDMTIKVWDSVTGV
ncbi:hypothetical protein Ddye_006350 [Dipteronia dyeriana]|uniref:Uncharacterized protein n=1 Tax=Dipteronia dyeriana TaxID=168575 RepID=A0AAE0CQK7_9ROSI|nr:hypothetical protein Ddye_006350 [Dipteronia dyeriana]